MKGVLLMAASSNSTIKISQLAKDMKLKNNEVIDILTEKGIPGKTHSMGLDDTELSILLDTVTKTKCMGSEADFYAFDVEAARAAEEAAKAPKKSAKSAKTAEAKAEAEEKPESKAETKPEMKTESKAETKPEVKVEPKAETKPEVKAEAKPETKFEPKAETKPEGKPEIKTERKPEQTRSDDGERKPFNERKPYGDRQGQPNGQGTGSYNRDGAQNGQGRPYGDRKPYGDRPNGQGAGGYNRDGAQNGQGRPYGDRKPYGDRPNGQGAGGYNRDGAQNGQGRPYGDRKPYGDSNRFGSQSGYNRDGAQGAQSGRFQQNGQGAQSGSFGNTRNGASFGDRPQGGSFGDRKKPQNQRGSQNGRFGGAGKEDDFDNQSVRQPSIKPVFDKDGRAKSLYKSENAGKKTYDTTSEEGGTVRLVDLRSGEVDLSKYDEKFENLAGSDKYEGGSSKKKNPRNDQNKSAPKNAGGRIAKSDSQSGYQKGGKHDKFGKKNKGAAGFEPTKKFTGPVTIPDEIMISDLAATLKITTGEVIKKLLMIGLDMASVGANKTVDFDTAYLVADEMGITAEREVVVTLEEKLFNDEEDTEEQLERRSPVVCVMGHVDHGKTSLLDAIRHTHVTSGEAGGITQHIGAYRVHAGGRDITFLDTPGHEAFTAMRARGAQATDIAILVVAADDGIMPQTIEAINHAKAAGIQIIVAINKMDKYGANPDAVKQELVKYELLPEEWGGDTICVPVSALKQTGIDELLEMVLLVADMKDLKANPNRAAKGIVIEAKLDKGRGPVATVLVQNGTLKNGDVVIAGMATGRVRAMTNDKGETVKTAGPSVPVEIIGLSDVPDAGDEFRAVEDERMARELVEKRKNEAKEENFRANSKVSLEDLFSQINEGAKELTVIVKADVQGSAEAVKSSLEKLSNDEVKVRVIHSAVGGITEGDVMLADASNAIIVGFNVRPDRGASDSAAQRKVDIRTYRVIYDCIEEVKAALCGMLAPEFRENVIGHAEVRQTIHVPGVGTIAGSYVTDGKVARNAQIRVLRDSVVIFEDKISSLKRFKDDVKEVASGYECGIGLERFNDIKEGDVLEAFVIEEVKRDLDSLNSDK